LKVDLINQHQVIDAEAVLAGSIKDEAEHLSDVEVPAPLASDVDVTAEAVADEFGMMEVEDELDATQLASVPTDDDELDAALSVEEEEAK
jgi:hypothetical protein